MAKHFPPPRVTSQTTLNRSRKMRNESTEAERLLWSRLRDRQLSDSKFRRQYPIGRFIADFCCIEWKLVVELDGEQHAEHERYDDARTASLEAAGFRTLRFWNAEVLNNVEGVVEVIAGVLGEHGRTS